MAIDPRTLAPIVSLGAAMLVKKALKMGYQKKTGEAPPSDTDLSTPIATVLLWATLTALSTALINVAINRGAAKLADRHEHALPAAETA